MEEERPSSRKIVRTTPLESIFIRLVSIKGMLENEY
jgi:hypothetical protein